MGIAIVAIPTDDDPVWKYSSEKIPHMTLLFLGDGPVRDQENVVQFIQHVAKTSLSPFGMNVKRRGLLGPNDADVLFFNEDWMSKDIKSIRANLMSNEDIAIAVESAPQFEGWVPHLTMGFPETPAKIDDREYPGFSYIRFDRIAIWFDDYDGPEFLLECADNTGDYSMPSAAWSDKQEDEEEILHADVGATAQDVYDDLSDDQKDLFATVIAAAVDDVDLSYEDDIVAGYNALSEEQQAVLDFFVGVATSDEFIDPDENDVLRQTDIGSLAADILEHSGVKGMKWGIRNTDNTGGAKLRKDAGNTKEGRAAARAKVKSGKATLGDAHRAAIKSRGHRIVNALLGDKTYWKRTGILVAATVAATGVALIAAPAAAATVVGLGLTASGVNGYDSSLRALRGNQRISNSYNKLGSAAHKLATEGDARTTRILKNNGSLKKKFLTDSKTTAKHSAIEELVGDILDPKDLEHSGVKGMRWGVTTKSGGGTVSTLGIASLEGPKATAVAIRGTAANPTVPKINKSSYKEHHKALLDISTTLRGTEKGSFFHKDSSTRKFNDAFAKNHDVNKPLKPATYAVYNKGVIAAMTKDAQKLAPTGTKVLILERGPGTAAMFLSTPDNIKEIGSRLSHSNIVDGVPNVVFEFKRDESGIITDVEALTDLKQSAILDLANEILDIDDLIEHSGVLGMKWGYRRAVGGDGLVKGSVPKNPHGPGPGHSPTSPAGSADHERAIAALAKKNTHGTESLSNQEIKDIQTRMKALDELHRALNPHQKSELEQKVDQLRAERELRNLTAEQKAANQSLGKKLVKGLLHTSADLAIKSVSKELGIFGSHLADSYLGNSSRESLKKAREKAQNQAEKEAEERRQDLRDLSKKIRDEKRQDLRDEQKRDRSDQRDKAKQFEKDQRAAYAQEAKFRKEAKKQRDKDPNLRVAEFDPKTGTYHL